MTRRAERRESGQGENLERGAGHGLAHHCMLYLANFHRRDITAPNMKSMELQSQPGNFLILSDSCAFMVPESRYDTPMKIWRLLPATPA